MKSSLAHNPDVNYSDLTDVCHINTTLYDLIKLVSEEVKPGEDRLVVQVVLDLIESGKAKWAHSRKRSKLLKSRRLKALAV